MLLKEQTLLLRLPLMGKKKVAEKMNFPQHNSPCFVLFQKLVFSKKIKNIFSFLFTIYLGSSCLKL